MFIRTSPVWDRNPCRTLRGTPVGADQPVRQGVHRHAAASHLAVADVHADEVIVAGQHRAGAGGINQPEVEALVPQPDPLRLWPEETAVLVKSPSKPAQASPYTVDLTGHGGLAAQRTSHLAKALSALILTAFSKSRARVAAAPSIEEVLER